jgi:hypothetical protein
MQPSPTAQGDFDGKRAWGRLDFKSSQFVLNGVAECFFQRLYKPVAQAAIDYRAEIATGAKQQAEPAEDAKSITDSTRELTAQKKAQLLDHLNNSSAGNCFSYRDAESILEISRRTLTNWLDLGRVDRGAKRSTVTVESLKREFISKSTDFYASAQLRAIPRNLS